MLKSVRIAAITAAVLLSLSVAGCAGTPKAEFIPTPDPTPIQWAPEGYTQYNESLAYKFTTQEGEWPCEDCNFWKVTVLANEGCPDGVYGELNMLDSSDTVVDWSNDTVPYLGAGQKAILTFEHYPFEDSYKTGQVTQLSCN